jgi:hypothetical protein
MSPRKYLITATCIIASFAVAEIACAEEIKVMSDTPLASALVRIGDVFHRDHNTRRVICNRERSS